jgi:hypothetical protein
MIRAATLEDKTESRPTNHANNDGQSDPRKMLNAVCSPGAPLFTTRVV